MNEIRWAVIHAIIEMMKMPHIVYQSTQNFTLIPKMYNFLGLSSVIFELWPFKDWKRSVLSKIVKLGLFQSSNGHNSRNTQDRPMKLYIFGISVKFCVDWYIIWSILIMFEISENWQVPELTGGNWQGILLLNWAVWKFSWMFE